MRVYHVVLHLSMKSEKSDLNLSNSFERLIMEAV